MFIDFPHQPDLMAAFQAIVLVNAQGINPQPSLLVVAQNTQRTQKVTSDGQ
jgi:hypothetical protein